ncbi:MAG: hypothetical protein HY318_17355 [Armatimonadetes bacterium]|nr:hypothetical protein [Armatimonadota bacterium]
MKLREWIVDNPVLRYHLLEGMRLRARYPRWLLLTVGLLILSLYLWAFKVAATDGSVLVVIGLQMVTVCLVTVPMTHAIMSVEFEKATWEALVLTKLTAGQIVMGKFLSRIALMMLVLGLFQPLLWAATIDEFGKALVWSAIANIAKAEIVIIAWALLLIAATLYFSYRWRRGLAAAVAAFGGQVFALFILPGIWAMFVGIFAGSSSRMEPGHETLTWMFDPLSIVVNYSPIMTLGKLIPELGGIQQMNEKFPFLWGTWQATVYLLVAFTITNYLMRSVARATRKPV